jgi:hypothetical protein
MKYSAERYFVSNKGFHIEFKSLENAEGFYQDALKDGSRVELHGHIVIMLTSKYFKARGQHKA